MIFAKSLQVLHLVICASGCIVTVIVILSLFTSVVDPQNFSKFLVGHILPQSTMCPVLVAGIILYIQ